MTECPNDNPILAAWERVHASRNGATAIFGTGGEILRTYGQIESEARAAQIAFVRLPAGTAVGLQFGNDARFVSTLLALWRAGLVPMPLDRSMSEDEVRAALAMCGASALVRPNLNEGIGIERRADATPIDAAFLKLTSGTSCAARAVRFTAGQLFADCDSVCDTMGIGEGDVNFGVIPWSHSYGFSNLVTPLLCRGVPMVATDDRLPRAILDALARSGATVFPGLPVLFQKLSDLESAALPRLRLCISAGAPLASPVAADFRDRFGLKVHGFYGSSECGGIAYDASDDPVPQGCVGHAMRDVRLVRHDPSGRVEVHGPAVGVSYFPEPDPSVLGDGRFCPGDILQETPHGFVLSGRVSDFINVAGRKLNPAEVESRLREIPGVRDAVVFGVSSVLRGEVPVACIVADATAALLRKCCMESLAAWQVPRDFWIVDALPVNERGKLNRRALAEAYEARPRH